MYYLDLFSGIGGFALGAYWAGWRFDEHYYSEIDTYCCSVYRLRFLQAKPLGDIRKIDVLVLPKGDWIITGGFPCQDISIAGKGEGISGARSGLWFEMWRIIRILRHRGNNPETGSLNPTWIDWLMGYPVGWTDLKVSEIALSLKSQSCCSEE